MAKRRQNVRHKPARVLLSETLPFEVPVTFSNSGFYKFLNDCDLNLDAKLAHFREIDPGVRPALRVIFGPDVQIDATTRDGQVWLSIRRKHFESPTIPFQFGVRYGGMRPRQLSIPHPMSQFALIGFYQRYRSLILYHSGRGNFSIRHPKRTTRYTIHQDSVFNELLSTKGVGSVEASGYEYDRIRSYFVYARYDNIYKFYESPQYRASERRFGHLLRLDVSKCFDSIYTHSIEWATHTKEAVKQEKRQTFGNTFARDFDVLIRAMNDDETHGILIGPEVSRIFAEVVLQRIDSDIEGSLEELGLRHGIDYQILRYVDDYFIFMRNPNNQDRIVGTIEDKLRPYRFHLNTAKESINTTPFISDISIAKERIRSHVRRGLRLESDDDAPGCPLRFGGDIAKLVSSYKTVLRETGLAPAEMVNFTLSTIENALESAISMHNHWLVESAPAVVPPQDSAQLKMRSLQELTRCLYAGLELAFYVYGGSPRVTPAIKLSRIVSLCRKAADRLQVGLDRSGSIDDLIFKETRIQLSRNPLEERSTVEGLYLLTVLGDLGDHYRLEPHELCDFARIGNLGNVIVPDWFDPMVVIELLRYMKVHPPYTQLRKAVEAWAVDRVETLARTNRRYSEIPLYVMGVCTDPHAAIGTKRALLATCKVDTHADVRAFLAFQDRWFTNWGAVDLHTELLLKRVQEVY